ncbi:hypothetical protein BO86DRAFT_182930 [Aspergillus japonicus CBS 114.51]|uniref:Secreted protein n=1 Tax=Aspergillus japonicus CBS 114.51 TaxID=1448312 RepID=A0A8T8WRU8_ASPJA|nr:hypothetical protein BO86DRAFT_182930 [Aspergillus japonicus CBS 114.51]RAH78433.1 hypothetical protein BO86DRAFT_182930 [Aspergillus japonicus CBS 114.51]
MFLRLQLMLCLQVLLPIDFIAGTLIKANPFQAVTDHSLVLSVNSIPSNPIRSHGGIRSGDRRGHGLNPFSPGDILGFSANSTEESRYNTFHLFSLLLVQFIRAV